MNEELVDLIADSIYKDLRERAEESPPPFYKLNEEAKNYYRHVAQNVISVFEDYYDGEYDNDDEDFDDDAYDEDDEDEFDWPLDI